MQTLNYFSKGGCSVDEIISYKISDLRQLIALETSGSCWNVFFGSVQWTCHDWIGSMDFHPSHTSQSLFLVASNGNDDNHACLKLQSNELHWAFSAIDAVVVIELCIITFHWMQILKHGAWHVLHFLQQTQVNRFPLTRCSIDNNLTTRVHTKS